MAIFEVLYAFSQERRRAMLLMAYSTSKIAISWYGRTRLRVILRIHPRHENLRMNPHGNARYRRPRT